MSLYQSGAPLMTVDKLLEQIQHEKPPGAPHATIRYLGGNGWSIALRFRRKSANFPLIQRLNITPPNDMQEVLVKPFGRWAHK